MGKHTVWTLAFMAIFVGLLTIYVIKPNPVKVFCDHQDLSFPELLYSVHEIL